MYHLYPVKYVVKIYLNMPNQKSEYSLHKFAIHLKWKFNWIAIKIVFRTYKHNKKWYRLK